MPVILPEALIVPWAPVNDKYVALPLNVGVLTLPFAIVEPF